MSCPSIEKGCPKFSEIKYIGHRWAGTEFADEDDDVSEWEVDGEAVEVGYVDLTRVEREGIGEMYVIWGGALDFEGSREDFVKRYPDLAAKLDKKTEAFRGYAPS